MIRMPEGIDGERFYQKHWDASRPEFVETVTVFSEHKDEKHDYILAQQSADAPVAGAERNAGIPRLALARQGRAGCREPGYGLCGQPRVAGGVGPQLPGLPGVRYRSVHLFGPGGEGRRARAEPEGLRGGRQVAFWIRSC